MTYMYRSGRLESAYQCMLGSLLGSLQTKSSNVGNHLHLLFLLEVLRMSTSSAPNEARQLSVECYMCGITMETRSNVSHHRRVTIPDTHLWLHVRL